VTPCPRCTSLGFITLFDTSDLGRVEICPTCGGKKSIPDPAKARIRLGICKFCHKEIHFPASDIPCIVERRTHVITPQFNPMKGEDNG
jgi:hypothetical protein